MKDISKIYGPYSHKNSGRKFVVICYEDGSKVSRSLARHMMEQHLGRELEDWEQVDHVNDDCTDDRIENFQILTVTENVRKSARKAELIDAVCPNCGVAFKVLARQVRHNQNNLGKFGPFCCKSCAGQWSTKNGKGAIRRVNKISNDSTVAYCTGCKQFLPKTNFSVSKIRNEGVRYRCKNCTNRERRDKRNQRKNNAA